ncbi:hypothetical protein HK099_004159 [Clydaea vesicula]|uniref:Thioredoxin domain-containing protein n=1 Tax=Clydaea vesicula TaxID=447962 RepID=A0AAD5XZS2_9FUNG|nr:hypothetical protein HK099_004159 [Clydaea vesicula]
MVEIFFLENLKSVITIANGYIDVPIGSLCINTDNLFSTANISYGGPCKVIGPVFDQLSKQYGEAKFIKVDVDECQQISQQEGVSAMPTCADKKGLENLVKNTVEKKSKTDASKEGANLAAEEVKESEEELMKKSVKEIKAMLRERGLSEKGCVEKRDLVLLLLKGKL